MRGHLGAVLTSGLAAIALALALLQAVVVAQHASHRIPEATAAHSGTSNRYSVPGGRSGIPFLPFEKQLQRDQGQKAPRQEEHHSPPPRMRAIPPRVGPQQPRKMAA